jgi:hypothetical protein
MKSLQNFLPLISEGVIADIQSGVIIGKIFGGYFNSLKNAKSFIKIGITPHTSLLSKDLKFADFGGGDGFLTKEVKTYLKKQKKTVDGIVLDGNPFSLEQAFKRGFVTIETALEDVNIKNFDLIIMRAVLHYNSLDIQRKILQRVKEALNSKGLFIHQLSSGDIYNVRLRNALAQLPALERTKKQGGIYFTTEEEYISLCKSIGLSTKLIGYAPGDSWTLEEMYERFHPEVKKMSQEQKMKNKRRNTYLKEAKELILRYKTTTPIQGVEIKKDTIAISRKYPIFLSGLS